MKIPVIDKNFGMYGILEKIKNQEPLTVGKYIQKDRKPIPIYYYERKQLKNKLNHGYVEI